MRYGIVGVGMMGREHVANLAHLRSEGVVLTCIADLHPPSLDLTLDLARSLGLPSPQVLSYLWSHSSNQEEPCGTTHLWKRCYMFAGILGCSHPIYINCPGSMYLECFFFGGFLRGIHNISCFTGTYEVVRFRKKIKKPLDALTICFLVYNF